LALEVSCTSLDVPCSFEGASNALGASIHKILAKDRRKLAGSPVKPHLGQQREVEVKMEVNVDAQDMKQLLRRCT